MTKRPKFQLFSELNNIVPSYSVYYIKKREMYSSNARKLQIDNSNDIPVFKLIYTEIISK